MLGYVSTLNFCARHRKPDPLSARGAAMLLGLFLAASAPAVLLSPFASAQQAGSASTPVVVQPGGTGDAEQDAASLDEA